MYACVCERERRRGGGGCGEEREEVADLQMCQNGEPW